MSLTNKSYLYVFTVVHEFMKLKWYYTVKSTSVKKLLDKLELQETIFGNPSRVTSGKVTYFTERQFMICCKNQGIDHMKVTVEMKMVFYY